jgi:hypothetical protein
MSIRRIMLCGAALILLAHPALAQKQYGPGTRVLCHEPACPQFELPRGDLYAAAAFQWRPLGRREIATKQVVGKGDLHRAHHLAAHMMTSQNDVTKM